MKKKKFLTGQFHESFASYSLKRNGRTLCLCYMVRVATIIIQPQPSLGIRAKDPPRCTTPNIKKSKHKMKLKLKIPGTVGFRVRMLYPARILALFDIRGTTHRRGTKALCYTIAQVYSKTLDLGLTEGRIAVIRTIKYACSESINLRLHNHPGPASRL